MTGTDLLVLALLGAAIVIGAALTRWLLGFVLLLTAAVAAAALFGVPLPTIPELPTPPLNLLPTVPGATP